MWKLYAVAFGALGMSLGCGPSCEDVLDAAEACYSEAGLTELPTCSGTPPAEVGNCQIDAYENGDCSTEEGVLDAEFSASACVLSSLPF